MMKSSYWSTVICIVIFTNHVDQKQYQRNKLKIMKQRIATTLVAILTLFTFNIISAQSTSPTMAVMNLDNTGAELSPTQLASLTRIEVTKYNQFEVVDQYDIEYLFKQNGFDADDCYGKICLAKAGEVLGVDKILSGSVETFDESIVITLRQVDVKSQSIEKAKVMEFLKIDKQISTMIEITVKQMYELEVNEDVLTKLTKPNDFENTINVEEVDVLNLSGPRMGLTFFTGDLATVQSAPKSQGGFDALPLMSQFGYQFEMKYLNSGNLQALFEFIPMITGLDQGRFIPSLTVLSGIRSNKTGLEFAFGPNLVASQTANGYMNSSNEFILANNESLPEGKELISRVDSRGTFSFSSGIVLAVGKTFRSGKLNVPVNLFYIPSKSSQRFGLSFGFNINK